MDKQSKNITKTVIIVLVAVILGEGIFGWGVFWPFLLTLLNWSGVYWLALIVGVLISVLRGVSIGLPSLFILVVVGGLSLVMSARKEMSWIMIIISILSAAVFNFAFGFGFSVWEAVGIIAVSLLALKWFEKSETIRVNY